MLLKYTGSRQYIRSDFDHKRYAFSTENNFICDVEHKAAIALLKTGQYVPVQPKENIIEKEDVFAKEDGVKGFVCKKCGKICKSKFGLQAHMRHCNK